MDRYIRQTALPDFGTDGQDRLTAAKVLVVGLGGLGLPALQYLNAMGVGTIGIMDMDTVEYHNLQRQILYAEEDVGKSKLEVALRKLQSQNSETEVVPHATFLSKENALDVIQNYDVVVDASDNFPTRYLINDTCVILNKPFVYGALHGFEGHVSVFNYGEGPTYRCLYPNEPKADEVPDCNENGVLGVIPGIIGNLQALETIKVLTGVGEVLAGRLLVFNGLQPTFRTIKFQANLKNKSRDALKEHYGILHCAGVATLSVEVFSEKRMTTDYALLDVRTVGEFSKHRLAEAIHVPMDKLDLPEHLKNTSKPIYVICQSGRRSEQAIARLQETYPELNFYNVLGGMNQLSLHTH